MSSAVTWLTDPIPRRLLIAGGSAATVILVGLFVFLGFPYDRLAEFAARQVAAGTGYELSVRQISPRITIGGPGLELRDLRVRASSGRSFDVERSRVRPAWSLSWLRGRPAVHLDVRTGAGSAAGVLVLAHEPAWKGRLVAVDLAGLPLPETGGTGFSGTLDADVDLQLREGVPSGQLSLAARDGSIRHAALPVAIPFSRLDARLDLGSEGAIAVIHSLALAGPMLELDAKGRIGQPAQLGLHPLDLALDLRVQNPLLLGLLQGAGVPLAADGSTSLRLGGSLEAPQVR